MGALVLLDPSGGSRAEPKRRYVLPVLLVAGWIGLFTYSAAYLTEDMPFRSQRPETAPAETTAGPRALSSRLATLDQADAASQRSTGDTAAPAVREVARPTPPSPLTRPSPAGPDYVGLWGPTPGACGHRSRRRGYIPATITPDQARAGRTLCTFHEMHRSGGAWVAAAECSDRGRRWSSQVRLTVDDDQLTWSSSRGTVTYTRCGRRGG